MALQVWLPLNGNLDNQGLNNNFNITYSNASIDNSGKISKCYSFNGSDQYISCNGYTNFGSSFTISFWIYINNTNTGFIICNRTIAYGGVEIYHSDRSGNKLTIDACATSYSSSTRWPTSTSLSLNTWYHITIIRNSQKILYYVNGELKETKTLAYTDSYAGVMCIGCRNENGNNRASYFNGKLNDLRIYNHCLSPKEVKELSKALVVHYTLDDNYQEMNNCYNYPTFNTSTATGGWNHWKPSGSAMSWAQTTDKQFIYNKDNTYAHKVTCSSGSYGICYQSPAFDGGYRSAQAIIKMSDSSHPSGKVSFSHNSNIGINPPNTYIDLGDGFYLMKHEGFQQSGSDDLVSIYVKVGYTVYISEAYLENGKQFCTNIIGKNTTVVYDSSGYGNNGVIDGTLTSEKDTPRYNKCLFFDGSSYITTPANQLVWSNFEQLTICAWMKPTSTPTNYSGSIGIAHDGNYTSKMFAISNYGGVFYVNITNGSSYQNYSSEYTCPLNEWHYYSATLNNTTVNMYVDGQLIKTLTISFGTAVVNSVPRIQVGVDLPRTDEKYIGYYSDVRIYATALSEKDILELYNTSANIDNNGNIFSYKFDEESVSQQKILKTGLVKIDNFIEFDNRFKILSNGSVFLQILHHNNPASNLFTTQNCWLNYDPNLFSNLIILKDYPMFNNLSIYEFLGIEKQTSSSTEKQVRWTQTSNPALSSAIEGYTLISGAWYNTSGNGLRLDDTTYSAMHNSNVWWGACGCYTPYQGGIPGYSVVVTSGYLDLYIRIPEEILNGNFEGFLKFFKKSILSTQLLEI